MSLRFARGLPLVALILTLDAPAGTTAAQDNDQQPAEAHFAYSHFEGTPWMRWFAAGDFDGDGNTDIAMPGRSDLSGDAAPIVTVRFGDGHGSFPDAITLVIATGNLPSGVLAADVNADGRDDLIVTDQDSASLTTFLGAGGRTFAETSYVLGGGAFGMAAADFDEDGRIDIAIGGNVLSTVPGPPSLTVLRSDASGFLTDIGSWRVCCLGQVLSVAAADFNGDGHQDLVLAGDFALNLLSGRGDGSFASPRRIWNDARVTHVVASDLNRDGRPDLAFTPNAPVRGVHILHNTGAGIFAPAVKVLHDEAITVAAADLNGDGVMDLAATVYPTGVALLYGTDAGGFVQGSSLGTTGYSVGIVTGDFDRNGAIDLAAQSGYYNAPAPPPMAVWRNGLRLWLLTPNDPSSWAIGTTQRLAWEYSGEAESFTIETTRDGGATWELVSVMPNEDGPTQNFYWTVTGPATSRARFRVAATGDPAATDLTDAYIAIDEPAIRMIHPYEASDYGIGGTHWIFFAHNLGANAPVGIDVSYDGGSSWHVIANDASTQGATTASYAWTVQGPPSDQALVRVRPLAFDNAGGVSVPFRISEPFIRVTRPTAGFNALSCRSLQVEWETNLGGHNFRLEFVGEQNDVLSAVTFLNTDTRGRLSLPVERLFNVRFSVRISSAQMPEVFGASGVGTVGVFCDD